MFYLSRQDLETLSRAGVKEIEDNRIRMCGNFWLEVEPDDLAFTPGAKELGLWEAWITVAIANELQNQGGDTVFLDVGANVGYYSMMAAAGGYRVRAFEPNPNLADMIARSAKFNNFDDVAVDPIALSDRTGVFPLSIHNGHSGAGSLEEPGERTIDVRVSDLDSRYFAKNDTIVFKVDVEGHERNVWNGCPRVRRDNETIWFLEWVPVRHGKEYNREWLEEVNETHDIQIVRYDGSIEDISIEDALAVEFETLVFRSR